MESLLTLLRPSLLPLTRSLPPALQSPLTALLGSACYTALIHDLRPTPTCLTLLLSKTLSLGIILAASIVKVPQILKLVAARSGKGVSLTAYLLETGAYVVALAYNARQGFAFSTYGETALIAVQNGVVVGLVLLYQDSDYSDAAADLVGARKGKGKGKGTTGRGRWMAAGLVGGVAMALWALFDETVVSAELLGRLMAAAGVVGVLSKGPQIWTVWRQGGTGQLSAFAVFNYLAGSLSRIFTTLQEVDDKLILYGFVAGFILNAILALQMVYYWNSPQTASHAAELGKEPEKLAMGSTTSAQVNTKTPTTRRRG